MSAAIWDEPPAEGVRPSRSLRTGNQLYRRGTGTPVRVSQAVVDILRSNPCNFGPCQCGNPVCPEARKSEPKNT